MQPSWCAPLALQRPQRGATLAHDEGDAVRRHAEPCHVLARLVNIDDDAARSLLNDHLDVVSGCSPLLPGACDLEGAALALIHGKLGARDGGNLLLRGASPAKDPRRVIV